MRILSRDPYEPFPKPHVLIQQGETYTHRLVLVFIGIEVYPAINLQQPSIIKTCMQPWYWPIFSF